MMHYKIVGVNENCPDQPQVYRGTFQETEEEPTMTAMVQQFGTPGQPARYCLNQWSGGEVSSWLQDLERGADRWQGSVGEIVFYVWVGNSPVI
jgi:hypothetical protein